MAFHYAACMELMLDTPAPGESPAPQEKPTPFYSLCDVCNLQLSSPAQAEVHYNGRSHLRRVRQLSNGEAVLPGPTSALPAPALLAPPPPGHPPGHITSGLTSNLATGSSCHSSTLPGLVRASSLMMQSSSMDMKPFLNFPLDGASPGGLFPNFNTMDPVQKAVINHTFGVSLPPKKKLVISCNICQLRFNSDSQAEAHYKGSKHAKKVKAQESGKTKTKPSSGLDLSASATSSPPSSSNSSTSSGCFAMGLAACPTDRPERIALPPSPEDASAPPPPPPTLLSSLSSCLSLTPTPPSPCLLGGETPNAALAPSSPGLASTPAATALGLVMKGGVKLGGLPVGQATPTAETEEEKAKKLLYCSLCKVAVNSLSQLEAHNTGSKHKTMLEARTGAGPIKAYPRPGAKLKVQPSVLKGSGLQNKTFHCQICDVHVNSEIQLKQHISSRRHKDRVAGKPMKPKYSPYNKQQRSSTMVAAKLALQKELSKPTTAITPTFLSSPFCPTTLPSISLHPRPNPSSLFQTSPLAPSFLRAAPGPIRPTTGSILFAPY